MYQDRRFRNMPPDFFVDEQLAEWRWNSHLFTHRTGFSDTANGPLHCAWCGWRPPTEMPLDHATLCPENPVIKAHLLKAVGDKVTKLMDDLKGGE